MNWNQIRVKPKRKISIYILPWLLIACLPMGLFSQSDQLNIDLDKLGSKDLLLNDSLLFRTQVSAASRSLQNVAELPFPIYVINRAEILRKGYITLADALKSLPGIRVSQPGSALEGETFTMRGLLGNTYAKILINGTAVKPYVVSGMPIGAQLPIQQAERIEVIYGPAAALYGADASSGIINIVLADSERPVFTKASLHVGSDNYTSLNLLFGGKIGKSNNVVRFKLYGTDTRLADRRIFYERDSLYNPMNYLSRVNDSLSILNDRNYRGSATSPLIQNTPHESRSLGGELKYRFLNFSVLTMNRSDHSALGLNPTAVAYYNPLASTGETITTATLKARFNIKKVRSEVKVEYLDYQMDNRSSDLYVNPMLNALINATIQDSINAGTIRAAIDDKLFSKIRFKGANSTEYSIEQTWNIPVFSQGDLAIGVKYLNGDGNSITEFQPTVVNFENASIENLNFDFEDQDIFEYSAFVQLFQPLGRKFNMLLGGQYLKRNNGDFAETIRTFNPRVALLYKASEKIQFRGSYSTAVRAPAPYFSATTYTFEAGNYEYLQAGKVNLEAERTTSLETGLRWKITPRLNLDLSLSYTKTRGFINYNLAFDRLETDSIPGSGSGPGRRLSGFTLGYFNDDNSKAQLFDAQAYFRFQNIIPSLQLGGTFGLNYAEGRESLTTTNVTNFDNEIRELNAMRAHPTVISHLSLFAIPATDFVVQLDQYMMSRSLTRNSFRLNAPGNMPDARFDPYNKGYYTIDLTLNYNINDNFLIYAKFFNILNTEYAGIDASSSNDVLFFNPQSLFTFHLGLNYELN